VAEALGFDFKRGRLDQSAHPFTTEFSGDDVRITTRGEEQDWRPMIMGTIHETGHALYEQGSHPDLARTPLAGGVSLGIHESQSRLWENVIGRSPAFWQYWWPQFQDLIPDVKPITVTDTVKAINHVRPSLIRTEADEVTYCLHIVIRFEIEQQLLADKLTVADLPEAWSNLYEAYLGIRPANEAEGVLQDVHWAHGAFGYFPTYAWGSLLAAQFMQAAEKAIPHVWDDIAIGNFTSLRAWLTEQIYQHGHVYQPEELIKQVTGEDLNPQYFIDYLKKKFNLLK
jgi:carboxypeptidase Taq